jgi:hypothetical protein
MLLGRPCVPVVQWLGHRPFTAVTRVRIPSGTPNPFNNLEETWFESRPARWQMVGKNFRLLLTDACCPLNLKLPKTRVVSMGRCNTQLRPTFIENKS